MMLSGVGEASMVASTRVLVADHDPAVALNCMTRDDVMAASTGADPSTKVLGPSARARLTATCLRRLLWGMRTTPRCWRTRSPTGTAAPRARPPLRLPVGTGAGTAPLGCPHFSDAAR